MRFLQFSLPSIWQGMQRDPKRIIYAAQNMTAGFPPLYRFLVLACSLILTRALAPRDARFVTPLLKTKMMSLFFQLHSEFRLRRCAWSSVVVGSEIFIHREKVLHLSALRPTILPIAVDSFLLVSLSKQGVHSA